MSKRLKILLLEDNPTDAEIVKQLIGKELPDTQIRIASTGTAYLEELHRFQPDIILADNSLEQFTAIEALKLTNPGIRSIPFILITGTVSEEFAAEIIKLGADDYILKDKWATLPAAIESALMQKRMGREKLEATQRIIQNEEKYRTLIERVSESFLSLDTDWKFIYANTKAEQILKRFPGYLIGKHFWTEFPDGLGKAFHQSCLHAFETQENIQLEEYSTDFEKWFEYHIYPSHSGTTIYFLDISQRKNAEKELQTIDTRLFFHLENSPLGFMEWDNKLMVKSWSKRAEEIFGWTEEEVLGQSLEGLNLVYEQDLAWVSIVAKDLLSGKVIKNPVQIRNYTKDKGVIWCEWFTSVLKDGEGKVITVMSLALDITERNKSETSLLYSQQKYKLLFDSNPMPMWMRSMNEYSMIDVNESASRVFGYTRDEFLGMEIREFVSPENLDLFFIEYRKIFPEVTNLGVWKYKHKNGFFLDVELIVQDIIYNDQYVRLALAIDVTEKIKAEKKLKQSYEEIRQLVAHIVNIREEERMAIAREIHDELGQQLAGIKMDLSWMTNKLTGKDDLIKKRAEAVFELLNEAVKTVRRIATELRPSMLDDLGLSDAIMWQSQEFKKRSGLEVHCVLETAALPVSPEINVGLYRVFQESLTNIDRHAKATKVTVLLKWEDELLTLSVADNGQGFDTARTGRHPTLGLLGIKERMIMMGGSCEILTQPGSGTTVLATVPLQGPKE